MEQDPAYYKAYVAKNRDKVRAKNKAWADRNKKKRVVTALKWRAKNRDRFDEYQKKYREVNADKISATNIAYKQAHKDAQKQWEINRKQKLASDPAALERRRQRDRDYYKRNREHRIEKVKEYAAANTDKVRQWARVTRSNRRSVMGTHTNEQWVQRFKFYGEACAYCHVALTLKKAHRDHVIPLNRGGSNWASNLVPACKPCNLHKHTKRWTPHQPGPKGRLP